jgi:hypothetical protein
MGLDISTFPIYVKFIFIFFLFAANAPKLLIALASASALCPSSPVNAVDGVLVAQLSNNTKKESIVNSSKAKREYLCETNLLLCKAGNDS